MIEPEVAMEKLNSMAVEEILDEANLLECKHKKSSNTDCIIANILSNWTSEEVSVSKSSVYFPSKVNLDMPTAELKSREIIRNTYQLKPHVSALIARFDAGTLNI